MAANACQEFPLTGPPTQRAASPSIRSRHLFETAVLCAAPYSTRGSETMPWFRSLAERPSMTVISPLNTVTAQKAKKARV